VFLISGLWHGANWTFVVWGALNGFYLVFAIATEKFRRRLIYILHLDRFPALYKILRIVTTFTLICFAWIFFRASSFEQAIDIVSKIASLQGPFFTSTPSLMIYSLFGILFLLLVEAKKEYFDENISFFHNSNFLVRSLSYAIIVITILLIGVFDGGQFIYFQF
jgi:D-alanyl-lipoteichoic acid acyltransferase DltB (MBOAT superfamily)